MLLTLDRLNTLPIQRYIHQFIDELESDFKNLSTAVGEFTAVGKPTPSILSLTLILFTRGIRNKSWTRTFFADPNKCLDCCYILFGGNGQCTPDVYKHRTTNDGIAYRKYALVYFVVVQYWCGNQRHTGYSMEGNAYVSPQGEVLFSPFSFNGTVLRVVANYRSG